MTLTFKFLVGSAVFFRINGDDPEVVIITDRSIINGHNAYQTDCTGSKWIHEDFLTSTK